MKHWKILIPIALLVLSGAALTVWYKLQSDFHITQETLEPVVDAINPEHHLHPRLRGLRDWQRPEGPYRVALQVGHWNAKEAPEEQKGLRQTTGGSYGNFTEWEVALRIAQETEALLEAEGVTVDILPTTIPPNYWADAFVSIHADGNTNSTISGYKVAASRLDYTKESRKPLRAPQL
ncbi:MAG: N-acetylmuramoyl-L-alanine amidase [Candidatus Moraniibacteriota bacterium]